ncbi:MAG TPA: class E sortase [Acidimicrobiia bacterium]|nr:class E sortase [Acidimicrobiia bacterium]
MRRTLSGIGRVLVTAGLLILLFVAYQLWGTGILEARSQDALRSQFEQALRTQASSTSTSTPVTTPTASVPASTTTTVVPTVEIPPGGDAVAQIDIPKLGVSKVVVEGVDVDDLRKGPGHYPTTPLPGQVGNAAIAGHRTTYGAPFGDLDQLQPGDEIVLQTLQGKFTYKVSKDPFAVSPDDGDVLNAVPDPADPGTNLATLTLTTSNPKYSAAERLIVQAALVLPPGATPLPASPTPDDAHVEIAGLGGETSSRSPAILWGVIALLIGLAWWWMFHRYRRWYVWFAGAVPFLAALFVFFTYFERLLPSNY